MCVCVCGVAARRKEGLRGPFMGDRIVIVSNYTQTLDLITILCRESHYPVLRLDGSTTPAKRQVCRSFFLLMVDVVLI